MSLNENVIRLSAFRKQELSEEILEQLKKAGEETQQSAADLLSVWLPASNYKVYNSEKYNGETFWKWDGYYAKYRMKEYGIIRDAYQAIWEDLVYFPVDIPVTYENTWMFERNYGGKRWHEGTDLMPPKNKRDIYPVYSMTSGYVEKKGWLEKGGYRIGIRGDHGGYFYYAHLASYDQGIYTGKFVKAGELLGYMGDSGYGKEGTIGKFDVHLHVGIYLTTAEGKEISVNPYWVLKYMESHKLKCKYYL